jgi:urease subunit gamma/beta
MNLTPTELERLTIFTAAEFARRNLAHGVKLSHPEAVAYITDEVMMAARRDMPYQQIRDAAGRLLTAEQVMPGVASMIRLIAVDASFEEGTKLIAVFDPIPMGEDELAAGEIIPGDGAIKLFEGAPTLSISVLNTGDRDVQVRSQSHFFEVNPALAFDRAATWGYKLAVPSGGGVRFEPGIPVTVELVAISGGRIITGFAGLAEGSLDEPAVRAAAFAAAEARGYFSAAAGPAVAPDRNELP